MSQNLQRTEGIVLRTIPYRDFDQIFFLFTLDAGLIKVFCKGSRSRKRGGRCEPMNLVEVIYSERDGELFSCREMACLESFPNLRNQLLFLEVAGDLLQIISSSQCVGKPSPHLYQLLLFYLKKIPHTAYPWILSASFRLKLLKHEGLLDFPLACSDCQKQLNEEAFMQNGESWCTDHLPHSGEAWNSEELQLLYRLAMCQNFSEIGSQVISSRQFTKINALYSDYINQ